MWQLGTIQLDFNMPERFGLEYVGADNHPHRPVMVHRAVLGSIERFFGVLIEHFAGAFPFWLSPVQCVVIPIGLEHVDYCKAFLKELKDRGIRATLDDRNESMGLKTREAQIHKLPLMLVAGEREIQEKSFSLRKYREKNKSNPIAGKYLCIDGIAQCKGTSRLMCARFDLMVSPSTLRS